jgi:hypothetical protein
MFYPEHKLLVTASSKFNPMHGLESPDEAKFATQLPRHQFPISTGVTAPMNHEYGDLEHGIAKGDEASHVFEPLAYHLGKSLGVPVPKTVLRQFPAVPQTQIDNYTGKPKKRWQVDPNNPAAKLRTFSVQQRVPGEPTDELSPRQKEAMMNHPDFHKMALFDWLTGNGDRHGGNTIWEHHKDGRPNRVHAIDNGHSFGYHDAEANWKQSPEGHVTMPTNYYKHKDVGYNTDANMTEAGLHHPVPQDFRQSILDADPEAHREIMSRFFNHPNFAKAVNQQRKAIKAEGRPGNSYYGNMALDEIKQYMTNHYLQRLNTLKSHMANPEVRTMGDLHRRLFHDN